MEQNSGAPLPVYPGLRWHGILNIAGSHPYRILLLSPSYHGYWLHWVKNLDNPKGCAVVCPENGPCWACGTYGLRWNGYIAGVWDQEKTPRVVHLPEGAARDLLPYRAERQSLRGLIVTFQRSDQRRNAPVRVLAAKWSTSDVIPADFPVEPSLRKMWGVSESFQFRLRNTDRIGDRSVECDPDAEGAIVKFNRVERDQEEGGYQ